MFPRRARGVVTAGGERIDGDAVRDHRLYRGTDRARCSGRTSGGARARHYLSPVAIERAARTGPRRPVRSRAISLYSRGLAPQKKEKPSTKAGQAHLSLHVSPAQGI